METQLGQSTAAIATEPNAKVVYAAIVLLVITGSLIVYKATASLAVIEKVQHTRAFEPRGNVVPIPGSANQVTIFARSVNYFSVIWPALLFGILISGAVRVLDPPRWFGRAVGGGRVRSNLLAGLAGAPLMLCSCCVAPVFSGVYERSSRLGPSLAVVLAAPSLNPAALILTFMLFGHRIGFARLVVAGFAVFFTGMLIERFVPVKPPDCSPAPEENLRPLFTAFLRSSVQVALRTIPLIAIGVLVSMAIAFWLPLGSLASASAQLIAVAGVALLAVPLALPTFFEIPLALLLLSAGAPPGAAFAMLIAGPAINLPSLFTVGRSTNWKVAVSVAVLVFLVSVLGGYMVNLI